MFLLSPAPRSAPKAFARPSVPAARGVAEPQQIADHPVCVARTVAGPPTCPPKNSASVAPPVPVEACGDPRIHRLEIQGLGG